MSVLGIIGGSGFGQFEELDTEWRQAMTTPWGEPSAPLLHGRVSGHRAVFLARHGSDHAIPPHAVNYRANVWALREAGVDGIIAVNAVGGIGAEYVPGTLVVPHQVIDYSWGRAQTFHDGAGRSVQHVDFTEPYSRSLRELLLAAAERAGMDVIDGAVYGVTQGPRLETAAEIDRLARDGCDLVGMTGMPEAGLARELGLEYACCAVVVNHGAGRGGDIHREFERWLDEGMTAARRLLGAAFAELGRS